MAQLSKYAYRPLQDAKSGIRLLSVLRAAPGDVVCSLHHIPNLQHVNYNCLSYTWGDPFGREIEALRQRITCDGAVLEIGNSLYDALLHLFKIQKDKLSAIWIDAVSIRKMKMKRLNSSR